MLDLPGGQRRQAVQRVPADRTDQAGQAPLHRDRVVPVRTRRRGAARLPRRAPGPGASRRKGTPDMTTDGIEALFLETHNWGRAARFFQDLGYQLDFETDPSSGQLRNGD